MTYLGDSGARVVMLELGLPPLELLNRPEKGWGGGDEPADPNLLLGKGRTSGDEALARCEEERK